MSPSVKDLSGKKVFITGAASGIGRATAVLAAQQGAELYLTDVNVVQLKDTAAHIEKQGGHLAHTKAADVSDYDQVTALADEIGTSMDVVMNIAGISAWGTVENLPHETWRKLIEVNLMGPIHVIEAFIPPMIRAGNGGYLVNVSSAAGLIGMPWHAAYSASKFGIRGVSEVLRFDLRPHGIGVSLVCPGGVATPLAQTVQIAGVDKDDERFRNLQAQFVRHAVSPESAAKSILNGMRKGQYMVYTSTDIRLIHLLQRDFDWAYSLAMRAMNFGANKLLPMDGTTK